MTNFELGTRVPFIIRDPATPSSHGKWTQSFAELVDLYKTLADLAGLPSPDSSKVQGRSLKHSLLHPDDLDHSYAYSQFAKKVTNGKPWDTCTHCHRNEVDYMGLAIRNDTFRLVQWCVADERDEGQARARPRWCHAVRLTLLAFFVVNQVRVGQEEAARRLLRPLRGGALLARGRRRHRL